MKFLSNLILKVKSFNITQGIIGFFAAIVAFLLSLLAIESKKRKDAETKAKEVSIENQELKIEKEIDSKPISDLVDEHNRMRNDKK